MEFKECPLVYATPIYFSTPDGDVHGRNEYERLFGLSGRHYHLLNGFGGTYRLTSSSVFKIEIIQPETEGNKMLVHEIGSHLLGSYSITGWNQN